jgi:hypothetical protein
VQIARHDASAAAELIVLIISVLEPDPMNKAIAVIALEPSAEPSASATPRY